ncbi:MAG: MFS transporter [Spirochaetia bacterium]|nr:MFS transporter [Spirochaetia bacterium]
MKSIYKNKQIFSWMLNDWANSAFATTVMAGFFPIFFKSYWSSADLVNVSTAKLAFANSFAGILIAVTAPFLGAIADRSGAKRKFLLFFTLLGGLSCICMSFIAAGRWQSAVFFYVLASIGFFSSTIFYDSMLTDVTDSEKDFDNVSSGGYALGYLGGGILFAVNVWWTLQPSLFCFSGKAAAVKGSFMSAGIWWIIFSLPLFITSRKNSKMNAAIHSSAGNDIKSAFQQIRQTLHEIRHLKVIFTFLVAYWLYIDGVDTIIRMAIDYGLSIGFSQVDLITALLMIQFLAFPFTYITGMLATKTGTRQMIYFSIAIYIIICIWAAFLSHKWEFFAIAFLISMVQGATQALSRSYFASLIPAEKSAEYFGFYNMLGKFAVILGPILMGITNLFAGYLIHDAAMSARIGMLSVVLLFISGAFMLSRVDEKAGRLEKKFL